MLYPIGIQSFEKLRKNGCVYVDKTALVYQLVKGGDCYFLSRPRRFGKSLLLSTLEAYFLGRRDLFKGLAAERLEKDWTKYPVLHVDMSVGNFTEKKEALDNTLNSYLTTWEREYGSDSSENDIELRFTGVIRRACEKTGAKVVVLIDEYDAPLLDSIERPELQEHYRNTLRSFYKVLKSQDQYIRFTFLTGVTKFSQVSIFSGLNNLNDISLDEDYAGICGITENELETYFHESILEFAAAGKTGYEEARDLLRKQYDGYRFSVNAVGIYNPFSLINTFYRNRIQNYWFASGTPTYLTRVLRKFNVLPTEIMDVRAGAADFMSTADQVEDWVPLMYQSGYLTITGYDGDSGLYTLGIPNGEVRTGLFQNLVPGYIGKNYRQTNVIIAEMAAALRKGRVDDAMRELQKGFSSMPHGTGTNTEANYQQLLVAFLWAGNILARIEERTAKGRIDIIFEVDKFIYILELKVDKSAAEALRQIEDRDYASRYSSDPRPVIKIGVNFSSKERSLTDWAVA